MMTVKEYQAALYAMKFTLVRLWASWVSAHHMLKHTDWADSRVDEGTEGDTDEEFAGWLKAKERAENLALAAKKAGSFRSRWLLNLTWLAWTTFFLDTGLQGQLVLMHYQNLHLVKVWSSWLGLHLLTKLEREQRSPPAQEERLSARKESSSSKGYDVEEPPP